jgi:hypothetical protein
MDIEGFETDVIRNSIRVIEQADVISIELHGTKESVDGILCPRQFLFRHSAGRRACKIFISEMLANPRAAFEVLLFAAGAYPKIVSMWINETRHNDRLITGVYAKPAMRDLIIQ